MNRARRFLIGLLAFTMLPSVFMVSQQRAARPAPTASDWTALAKLPDFTGVWEAAGGGGAGARGAAGPQLTPAYAAKAAARPPSFAEDNISANCVPPGLPLIMNQPYPMEFLLTPGQVTIVIEAYTQVRHIYTDGRNLPGDPEPSFNGTSVGHWEDNTLVVESAGFEDTPRGISFPYSGKMKIVERFTLTGPDAMTVETTIVDTEALKAPYSMGVRTLKRHRNWTIAEYVCQENNRNFLDNDGKAGIRLSDPGGAPR